jgi:capsular polysaccharide biosynthesis protein
LFVSRGVAKQGALVNEAGVVAALLDYDFEFLTPRAEDHKTLIEAFGAARIVVAAHGEALTNLLFCQPGTLVIELFASNQIKSDYCWLALRLGLRYRAVKGFQGDAMQAFSVKVHEVMAQVAAELGPLPDDDDEEDEDEDEDEAQA